MPPLNITKESKHHLAYIQSDANNNSTIEFKKSTCDEEDEIAKEFGYFHVKKPVKSDKTIRYVYIDDTKYGFVWPNIIAFSILHIYYIYALFRVIQEPRYKTWFFRKYQSFFLPMIN